MNTSPSEPENRESDRVAIGRQLDSIGWVLVWSEVLAEAIVVTRDASVRPLLPDAYRGAVGYLCDEVASLVGVGPEDLRVLHEIKRVFRGAHSEAAPGAVGRGCRSGRGLKRGDCLNEDAQGLGRLSLGTALAFANAVAVARGETAVAGLLAGILSLAEDGRFDEINSRVAWAPEFLWGEKSDSSERRPVVHLETAGIDGLPAALVAAEVLALGRRRFGIGSGPIEARHLAMVDALLVALAAAVEAREPSVATALSIILEAVASGDADRLAAFFSESDVPDTAN